MEKVTTIKQATDKVYHELKKINQDIEKDDVYDIIMEEILESTDYEMTDKDLKFLQDNEKDPVAVNTYLKDRIEDYEELLSEIVTDMISDEALDID